MWWQWATAIHSLAGILFGVIQGIYELQGFKGATKVYLYQFWVGLCKSPSSCRSRTWQRSRWDSTGDAAGRAKVTKAATPNGRGIS